MTKYKVSPPKMRLENCSVTNTVPPTNEHTARAVEALSKAAEANAIAIQDIAKSLKGPGISMGAGFRFDAPKD